MPDRVLYSDVHGNVQETTWTAVHEACGRIEKYFAAIGLRFFEREDVLKKIKYGFLTREHVLIRGPTGAAKTKVISTVFRGIEGAHVWSINLTRATGDTHIFGNYDIREMQASGKMHHMTEDTLADTHFAKLGEFFDASDYTLRALLDALNEREVRRGSQFIKMPLMTVLADTNFDPDQMPQRRAQLDAVVDRFLFQTSVHYVKDPGSRYNMLDMELNGSYAPLPPLTLQDIILVSGVVRAMNLFKDRYVKEAYAELTYNFSQERVKQGRSPLSDRRFVRAAHIMEVCALLNGRTEVTFEDLKISRHVLASHPDDEAILEAARHAAITTWIERSKRREIDVEMHALKELTDRAVELDVNALSLDEVKRYIGDLDKLHGELKAFNPHSIEVRTAHIEAIAKLNERMMAGEFAIMDKLVVNLPVAEEGMPREQLGPKMDQARRIREELMHMKPGSERAIIRHREAMAQVIQVMTALEMEFGGKRVHP